jgi:type IV pilus assembly protein PilA
MQRTNQNGDGFTLIELMVVIAIVSLIIAMAVPYYLAYKRASCDTSAKGDIATLADAMERLRMELSLMNCSAAFNEIQWTPELIGSLVGPYYGWGGTSGMCQVRVWVEDGTAHSCAIKGSPISGPASGDRFIFRFPVGRGGDLPGITGECVGQEYSAIHHNNRTSMVHSGRESFFGCP